MYYRYGHIDKIQVKLGDKVSKGQLIARNGTGNGQWYAHTHFDIFKKKQSNWNSYVIGKSKEWVEETYVDPRGLEKIVMPTFDHLGLCWLEYWDYDSQSKKTAGAKKPAWHSGLDLNGEGSGNADLDDPVQSAVDGIVEHIYNGSGKNDGWGKMVVINELIINNEEMSKYEKNLYKIYEAVEKFLKRDDGKNPNDGETKEIVDQLSNFKNEVIEKDSEKTLADLKGAKQQIADLKVALEKQSVVYKLLADAKRTLTKLWGLIN